MDKVTGSVICRYGFALSAGGATILGELFLDPVLGPAGSSLLLFAGVMASAWYGGIGPGLLAAVVWLSTAPFLLPSNPGLSLAGGGLDQALPLTLSMAEATLISCITALARDRGRSRQALKAAEGRREEFLALLSHELRNPLAPIRNAVHLMQMASLGERALTDARDVIERQVRLLANMVDDLLDIFRMSHDQITLHQEPLDLAELVCQIMEDHRTCLEDRGLRLVVDKPGTPVPILGDRMRLSQVLTNLLYNAAKFSNRSGEISVRLLVESARQRATVYIRDTGVGIPEELLPHIFDAFTQAEQGLERRRGGLGLGLTLVKGIIELHGGEVYAASSGPDCGAEFSFWLPVESHVEPAKERVPGITPSVRYLRILIVEDNHDAANTLGLLLRRFGHEVETAHSGVAGLQVAKRWRPDVVLCDLGLPEMDGYEVAGCLRRDPALAAARLIAVSGYGQDEDRRRSEEAGFDLHLTKPLDPSELQRLLGDVHQGPHRRFPSSPSR
jgi:signal transduction histidine kinase/ActR/RegA family two-component response regulator